MNNLENYCDELAKSAKLAGRKLAASAGKDRDRALELIAQKLRQDQEAILAANAQDIAAAPSFNLSTSAVDRLTLNPKRLAEMASAVDEIRQMPDPIGQIIEGRVRASGIEVQKVRVPLGVVFFIYESRPNVTTDAAALCVKSANAIILRGGKEAKHSNQALTRLVQAALTEAGLPPAAVSCVETTDRAAVGVLLKKNESIDLAIPRGGEDLIRRVAAEATMPVMKHFQGICHVYLDATAELPMALTIVENSKCQRPGVCNAAETLLVHADAVDRVLVPVAARLREMGVELRGCPRTVAKVPGCKPAATDDFGKEFLDLILAVKVVDSLEQAVDHIATFGSSHTETIVTQDYRQARRFARMVDSSAVMINASTRFNDGGQFGLGAEIGISTDKYHARGPCGLLELTSYKYIVYGDGQARG